MNGLNKRLLIGSLLALLCPGIALAQSSVPKTGQTYRTPLNIETAAADLILGPRPARPQRPDRVGRTDRPQRPSRLAQSQQGDRPDRPQRPSRSVFNSKSPTGFYAERNNEAPVNGAFDIIGNAIDNGTGQQGTGKAYTRAQLKKQLENTSLTPAQRQEALEKLYALEPYQQ